MLNLDVTPKCICYVNKRGVSIPLLAVSTEADPSIRIYDGRGERTEPIHVIKGLHRTPVSVMAFNNEYDCVVSADEGGMLEYWRPSGNYEKPDNVFAMKSSTNLFEFKKAKSTPCSITISPSGRQFTTFSFPDRKIRIFDFATGKLYRTYDESIQTITDMQQIATNDDRLEDVEFGRRLATERELENPTVRSRINVVFDETGHFILFGSLIGTKVINTFTNRVVKVYGKDEPFRSLNLALYQGQPEKKSLVTTAMAASDNPLLQEAEARDAMLVTTGLGKVRFYMFTNEEEYVALALKPKCMTDPSLVGSANLNEMYTMRSQGMSTSKSRYRRSKRRVEQEPSFTQLMATFMFVSSRMPHPKQLRTLSHIQRMVITMVLYSIV